jgi:hypothetical protein
MRFQRYQRGDTSMAILTTTKCRWRQWEVRSKYIKAVREEHRGQQMQ